MDSDSIPDSKKQPNLIRTCSLLATPGSDDLTDLGLTWPQDQSVWERFSHFATTEMGDPSIAAEILDRAVHHLPGCSEHFGFIETKTSKRIKQKLQLGGEVPTKSMKPTKKKNSWKISILLLGEQNTPFAFRTKHESHLAGPPGPRLWFRLHEVMEAAGHAVGALKAVTLRAQRAMKVRVGDWWNGAGKLHQVGDWGKSNEKSTFHLFFLHSDLKRV